MRQSFPLQTRRHSDSWEGGFLLTPKRCTYDNSDFQPFWSTTQRNEDHFTWYSPYIPHRNSQILVQYTPAWSSLIVTSMIIISGAQLNVYAVTKLTSLLSIGCNLTNNYANARIGIAPWRENYWNLPFPALYLMCNLVSFQIYLLFCVAPSHITPSTEN